MRVSSAWSGLVESAANAVLGVCEKPPAIRTQVNILVTVFAARGFVSKAACATCSLLLKTTMLALLLHCAALVLPRGFISGPRKVAKEQKQKLLRLTNCDAFVP